MPLSVASHAAATLADSCLQLVQQHAASLHGLAEGDRDIEALQNLLEDAAERFGGALPPLRGLGRPAASTLSPEGRVASAFTVAAAYARLLCVCSVFEGLMPSNKGQETGGNELQECKGASQQAIRSVLQQDRPPKHDP